MTLGDGVDNEDDYHSYSAAAAGAIIPVNNLADADGALATTNADGKFVSPEDVVGALETMARRNNYLTDRVEKLLDVIEAKGSAAALGGSSVNLSADPSVVSAENNLQLNAPSLSEEDEDEEEEEEAVVEDEEDDEEEDIGDKLGPSAVREPSVEVCVMQHPGALCCTRSEVATDETKRQATITLHTSVRHVEDKGNPDSMKMADYVALGAQAITDKAREMMETRTKSAVRLEDCKETEKAHDRITRLLQNGKVIWVEGMGEVEGKFGHPCYKLRLECTEGTGAVIDCVFKPAIEGNGDGWHRASMEYVAYRLSRMLGMDNVPPAAYRRPTGGIELDYKKFDEGAFLYWVDGADELVKAGDFTSACETGCWGDGVNPKLVLSDTRILDVLLHNSDRHSGHFLFARHWTQGGPPDYGAQSGAAAMRGEGGGGGGDNAAGPSGDDRQVLSGSEYRPVLIDHAASFRQEAFVSMEHENAFQTGPTTCVGTKTYLRLRFLDAKAIKDEFGAFLSTSEQAELLERRNNILAYLDHLVDTQGYDQTVIDH